MAKHKRRHHRKRKHAAQHDPHDPRDPRDPHDPHHSHSESDFESTPALPPQSNPDGTAYVFFGLCAVVAIVLIMSLAS